MANTINLVNTNVGRSNVNAQGYAVWADVSSATIGGRLFHCELVQNNESEFLAFTMITALQDGDTVGTAVKFNTNNGGLIKLFKGGNLPNGRRMTVIGQIKGVRSYYTNKDGVVVPLKRPEMELKNVNVQLGAKPSAANKAR